MYVQIPFPAPVEVHVIHDGGTAQRFYVNAPDNRSVDNVLLAPNDQYLLTFRDYPEVKTIDFFATPGHPLELAPRGSGSYHIQVVIDPGNQIAETDETNNSYSTVQTARVSDLAGRRLATYIRGSDWSGEDPALYYQACNQLSDPGAGTPVVVLPGGWLFDQLGAPKPGLYKNGVVYAQLQDLDGTLTDSKYDDYLGPTPGQFIAHELGHAYDLWGDHGEKYWGVITCREEYTACAQQFAPGLWLQDETMAGCRANGGLWVSQRMILDHNFDPPVMSVMGGSANKNLRWWISSYDYERRLQEHTSLPAGASAERVLFVQANVYPTDTATLGPWYLSDRGRLDSLAPGDHALVYYDVHGTRFLTLPLTIDYTIDGLDGYVLPYEPLGLVVPFPEQAARVALMHGDVELASRALSPSPPAVTVTVPNGGEIVGGSETQIAWEADDDDGDPLSFVVLYSADDGGTWHTLDLDLTGSTYLWTGLEELTAGTSYRVKVIATDGVRTSADESDRSFSLARRVYLPLVRR